MVSRYFENVYVPDMEAENIYPRVFFSQEDAERLAQVEADLWPYILKKRYAATVYWVSCGKMIMDERTSNTELSRRDPDVGR